jgi:hypothetical protein
MLCDPRLSDSAELGESSAMKQSRYASAANAQIDCVNMAQSERYPLSAQLLCQLRIRHYLTP